MGAVAVDLPEKGGDTRVVPMHVGAVLPGMHERGTMRTIRFEAGWMGRTRLAVLAQGRPAPATSFLLLAMVGVWTVENLLIGTVHGHRTLAYLGFGALPNVPVARRGSPGDWWRYTSTGLLHSRPPYHLVINSLALLLVGTWVERTLGGLAMLASMVMGVAAGSIVFVVASAMDLLAEGEFTVGCSAGICTLVGIMLVHGYRRRAHIGAEAADAIKRRAALGITLMVLIGLALPRVNNYAHAGGLACGLVLGRLLPMRLEGHGVPANRRGRAALFAVVLVGGLSVVLAGLNLASRLLEH